MSEKSKHCMGCRDDWYNHSEPNGCCNLEKAKLVRRWRLHWWTSPVNPRAFTEVEVLDCFHQPGQFAYSKGLPEHAVDPVRMEKRK